MSEETAISVGTRLSFRDYYEMFKVRLRIGRDSYRASPGLYKVGLPDSSSPVFVTANYKMSFDFLREGLSGMNAWILVLDTKGVNVWCAAGKRTFSTDELVRIIKLSGLENVVSHRELILPQLSAPGVAAHKVRKETGFKVQFGPIRARDIKSYMCNGKIANDSMRVVTFGTWERFILTPAELTSRIISSIYIMAIIFIVSGITKNFFAIQDAFSSGLLGMIAYFVGLFAGAFITPVLLPWIPGRSFALKGSLIGAVMASIFCFIFGQRLEPMGIAAIILFASAVSSYMALTFTGSTPFTSPSGVEKEMRKAIPLQIAAIILSCILWVGSNF